MTGTTPIDTIIQGDCLEEMNLLRDEIQENQFLRKPNRRY